jgi:predicted ATPase with chaperone activity
MVALDGVLIPEAPRQLADCDLEFEELAGLVLKAAYTVPKFDTKWAAEKVHLPSPIVAELLEQLRADKLLDILGHAGAFNNYGFSITARGREHARRLLEICGYVGPAPVSLAAYKTLLQWQFTNLPDPSPEQVRAAISEMVLPEEVVHIAGLAALSRRSLFLHGPPGNGKTTLGHYLHHAVSGELWVPYCISVSHNIIRVFDPQCHERADLGQIESHNYDRRWVRVKRPFIVVGGELTLDAMDLVFSDSLGYYEAPLHFKANGGSFLLDDFGCQQVDARQLLNRWIHPLERHVDFLTLRTGQQIEVPFRQMLIISTNLRPDEVMTPAFLRRMGYRLMLGNPSAEQYAQIFRRYADRLGATVPAGLMEHLFQRYQSEGRPLRGCEPRDLIERARDGCRMRGEALQLNPETLDLAWSGYFGNESAARGSNHKETES